MLLKQLVTTTEVKIGNKAFTRGKTGIFELMIR